MNVVRIFRLGIRVAEWATPHIKEWHRERHFNRTEAERHLQARNWAEAEKHLTQALQESHLKKHHLDFHIQLSRAQAKQNRLEPAAQSAAAAIQLAQASKTVEALSKAREALVDLQLAQRDFSGALATLDSLDQTERSSTKPNPKLLASSQRLRGHVL